MVGSYTAQFAYPVTPNDTANLTRFGAIKCTGAAGNLEFQDEGGVTRIYPIALGEVFPVVVKRVLAANTTATGLWCFAY